MYKWVGWTLGRSSTGYAWEGEFAMNEIKRVLMKRDGITSDEADEIIADARRALVRYLDDGDFQSAEDICEEYFGLEPDYLDYLI